MHGPLVELQAQSSRSGLDLSKFDSVLKNLLLNCNLGVSFVQESTVHTWDFNGRTISCLLHVLYLYKLFMTKDVEMIHLRKFFLLFCLGNLKKLAILMRTVKNMVECIHQSPSRIGIYNFESKLNQKFCLCPMTEFAQKAFFSKEITVSF